MRNKDNTLKESLWKQFGASIDMLKNAIVVCPEEYRDTKKSKTKAYRSEKLYGKRSPGC